MPVERISSDSCNIYDIFRLTYALSFVTRTRARFIIRGIYRKSLFADWDRFPFEETYRTCVCVGAKESAGVRGGGRGERGTERAQ